MMINWPRGAGTKSPRKLNAWKVAQSQHHGLYCYIIWVRGCGMNEKLYIYVF